MNITRHPRLLAALASFFLVVLFFSPEKTSASIPSFRPENSPMISAAFLQAFRWQPVPRMFEPPMLAVSASDSGAFHSFTLQVQNGQPKHVRGVYVEGVLALPIIEQPENQAAYVSDNRSVATLFSSAVKNGVTGLLAHNYLAGIKFYNLQAGQEVRIVYGDGRYRRYVIESIDKYQKLDPSSVRSELIELSSGKQMSTNQVFARYYRGRHHVTFQTCLANNGQSNWGLTFVVARPVQ